MTRNMRPVSPLPEAAHRRYFVVGLLSFLWLGLMLTGCDRQPDSLPTVTSDAPPPAGFPRTVADAAGRKILVEAPPERVAVIYNYSYGLLATLGIQPVGQMVNSEMLPDDRYFENGDSIPTLGPSELNLEKTAALKPDLILGGSPEMIPALETIAPVYQPGVWGANLPQAFFEDLRRTAEIFGLEKKAEKEIQAFKDRLAAYQAMLPPREQQPSTLVVGIASTSELAYTADGDPSRQILDLVSRCEWPSPTGETYVRGTLETLLALNPDIIIVGTGQPSEGYEALFQALDKHPLWNELSAVKENRVIFIPHYTNPTPHSLIGARILLDEMVPRIYPEIFPHGPLTDNDVRRILEEQEEEARQ